MKKQTKLEELLQIVAEKPDTREICAILRKMSKENFEISLGQALNEAISDYEDKSILFLIVPVVVEIASTNADLNLLGYLTFLKYNCDIRDPSTLSLESLKNYLNSLEQISERIGNENTPENAEDMGITMSDAYFIAHSGYILRTFGRDAIAFYQDNDFQEAFHVKCGHCGNDTHSLVLGESNITHLEELENTLSNKNLIWRANALGNLEIEFPIQQLFYLYGTYTCSQCGKENIPIKAVANYILAESGDVNWTVEKVQELEKKLLEKYDYSQDSWWDKLVFYGNYIAQLYWDVEGSQSLRPYLQILRISVMVNTFYGSDYRLFLIEETKKVLENSTVTDEKVLGDVYFGLGHALSYGYDFPEGQLEEALSHTQKAWEYYCKSLGEDDVLTINTKRRETSILAKVTGNFEPMKAIIEQMRADSRFSEQEVNDTERYMHSIMAEQSEERDFSQEIQDKLDEIEETIEEYGDNTDIVADYRGDLGELYIEAGAPEKALEHLEFALKIHTGELGKEYLLPPFLRNTIHKGKKLVGQTEDTSAFMMRVLSVAGALGSLSQYYVSTEEFKTALKYQKQGLELWQWAGQVDTVEIADKHRILAETYQKMGKPKNFEENFTEAKRIYLYCIENSPFESEVSESKEGLEELKKLEN